MQFINPTSIAPPAGGYSQGVAAGGLIFLAGHVGVDASGRGFPGDGGMASQTRQTIANIEAVLAEAGATLKDIVSTTCFVKDFDDYAAFNVAYDEAFGDHKPARATVRADMVHPSLLVEIQAIALKPAA